MTEQMNYHERKKDLPRQKVYAQIDETHFDEAFDETQFDEIMPTLTKSSNPFFCNFFFVVFFLGIFLRKHWYVS